MSELRDNPDNPEVVHETSDVDVSAILRYGAGLAGATFALLLFLGWLFGMYERQLERADTRVFPMAAEEQDRLPPTPRLQDNPQQDLRRLRAREEALLNGAGWVNKEAGVGRIPIDEAMRIVVEQGLPVREAAK